MPAKKTTKKSGAKKSKRIPPSKKKTYHATSVGGRKMASASQIARKTPYKARVNKAGHKSVMVGEKYGRRVGKDAQGREYDSKYRGKKAGYLVAVSEGDY